MTQRGHQEENTGTADSRKNKSHVKKTARQRGQKENADDVNHFVSNVKY